jgi:phosphoribosylglycinamide formyltransferase-1
MPPSTKLDARLVRLSAISETLPETIRELQGEHAIFRVKGKVFAYFLNNHHGDGIVAVACRTARGENADWIAGNPERFFMPAYIGHRGWVGLRLDVGKVDWKEVTALVRDSYRMAAPKRLAALLRP